MIGCVHLKWTLTKVGNHLLVWCVKANSGEELWLAHVVERNSQ